MLDYHDREYRSDALPRPIRTAAITTVLDGLGKTQGDFDDILLIERIIHPAKVQQWADRPKR